MLAALLLLPSCEKERLFDNDDADKPHSTVSFAALKKNGVEVNTTETLVRSAADAEVNVNTFTVEVTGNGKTYYNGTLGDMPEVLTMPVGEGFKVTVHSPENPAAAWDSPYYEGSQTFDVKENEVTYVDTVVCKLANVKVTIKFDSKLLAVMEEDCKVKVETGTGASLTYSKNETRSGFFRYEEADGQSTLVATFSGTVDENFEQNFRTYTSVAPGNHYIITYTLHGVEGDTPDQNGHITTGVYVDATVNSENLNINVDHDDPILSDTDRPTQGEDPGPGPGPGPEPGGDAPTVKCSGDLDDEVAWTQPHVVPADGMNIQVTVHSDHEKGLTAFTVDIDSNTLTPEVLSGVGLASHLDLVNPGDLATGLASLGFPTFVGGQQDPAVMDISEFTSLLGIYGAATHKFKITVSDGNGTTVKTLTLISE